jgi:hypothetical protein
MASKKQRIKFVGQKTPYNFELMDSGAGGEAAFAARLEADPDVRAWTRAHGIVIPYRSAEGAVKDYHPDFLIRRTSKALLQIVEVKGKHLASDPNVRAKQKAADDWCKYRNAEYILFLV